MSGAAARGAIFLDRDGTIIEDPGYLGDPALVRLLPGAGEGLAAMAAAGWRFIIVSNQSGIARGKYGPDAFAATTRRMEELLAPFGVRLTASYFCPHHPDVTGACGCRKPGLKLFRDAAAEHGIALGESWFIGDRWRDVAPAVELGGRAIMIHEDPLAEEAVAVSRLGVPIRPDLPAAAALVTQVTP